MESDRFGQWRLTHIFEDLLNQNFIYSLDNFHSACQISLTVILVFL